MASKKRGLGRGLDALLGTSVDAVETVAEVRPGKQLRDLPLDLIQRGRYQPRTDMDPEALQDLAASIRAQGVVQPIVVRPLDGENTSRSSPQLSDKHFEMLPYFASILHRATHSLG